MSLFDSGYAYQDKIPSQNRFSERSLVILEPGDFYSSLTDTYVTSREVLSDAMKTLIRRAKLKDLKDILNVASSTKVFSAEELQCLHDDLHEFLETDNEDSFVVAVDGDKVVGFAQWGPLPITAKSFMLHWIAVLKSTQGKGVGRQLVEKVERDVKRQNARILFIETSSRDAYDDTRAFYMKCGYLPVCVVPDYYCYGDAKVVFSKQVGDLICIAD